MRIILRNGKAEDAWARPSPGNSGIMGISRGSSMITIIPCGHCESVRAQPKLSYSRRATSGPFCGARGTPYVKQSVGRCPGSLFIK